MNRTIFLAIVAEFGPLLTFFIAGRLTNFFEAVAILMCSVVIAVSSSWYFDRRIPWLPIISGLFVLIGGYITLSFREPDAVIIADTFYYLFIVIALGVSFSRGIFLFKKLFGSVFAITDEGWRILCWRWFWFLLLAACSNEIARYFLTPEAWIDYRFYKSIVLTAFALYQLTLTKKYRIEGISNRIGLRTQKETTGLPL